MEVAIGTTYRHYKGGIYKVLHLGRHTETDEEVVIYQAPTGGTVWVRPLAVFKDAITVDGASTQRFLRTE